MGAGVVGCRRLRHGNPPRRAGQRTILKLNIGVFSTPINRSQIGSTISEPRAVVMSPRSMTSVWPKDSNRPITVFFASASLPYTNTEWSPSAMAFGLTISAAVSVLRALTTFSSSNAAWICSPQRIGVLDEQGGREALRGIEGVGDVKENLAREVLPAGRLQHGDRHVARGGVDDQLGAGGRLGEGRERDVGVSGRPRRVGRVAHAVGRR